jgi:DNA-binding Xre family transcriptional regulator
MFTWKVKEIAEARGIKSALQLAEAADIAPGTATSYWYNRPTRIDFPTLGKLLATLDCGIADLLEYDREKNEAPGLSATYAAVA